MLKTLCITLGLGMAAHALGAEPRTSVAPPNRIPDVTLGPHPAGEPVATASMPRAVRQAVVADAARRFHLAEEAVVLASAEQVTWSDNSLGCPKPGRSYLQDPVRGYRVMATSSDGRMLYHTDNRGNVVSCGPPMRRPGAEPRAQLPVKDTPKH